MKKAIFFFLIAALALMGLELKSIFAPSSKKEQALERSILGAIENFEMEHMISFVSGWACEKGHPEAVILRLTAVDPKTQQSWKLFEEYTRLKSEPALSGADRCGLQGPFRFRVALQDLNLSNHHGKILKIEAFSEDRKVMAELLGSGKIQIPMPLQDEKRGCLASVYRDESSQLNPLSVVKSKKDGWTYAAWAWSSKSVPNFSHSVSIVRSRDLKTWENLCGEKLTLPLTLESKVVVDPVLVGGGLRPKTEVGLDSENRIAVSVLKDRREFSLLSEPVIHPQVFNWRWDGNSWKMSRMTNWSGGEGAGKFDFGPVWTGTDRKTFQFFQVPPGEKDAPSETGTYELKVSGDSMRIAESRAAEAKDQRPKGLTDPQRESIEKKLFH